LRATGRYQINRITTKSTDLHLYIHQLTFRPFLDFDPKANQPRGALYKMVFGIHGPNHDKHADGAHEDRGREGRGRENVVASGRGGAGNVSYALSEGLCEIV
jgi:hypothetical protein